MVVPAGKDDLSAAIECSFDGLMLELRAVLRSYTERRLLDDHAKDSMMSVSNLITYLIG